MLKIKFLCVFLGLYSHIFLDKLFNELWLEDFFRSYKDFSKIQYDVLNFVRLLVYGRILNPDSKIATPDQNEDYFTPLLKDFNPYNVYDEKELADLFSDNTEIDAKDDDFDLTAALEKASCDVFIEFRFKSGTSVIIEK